ncbi:hypothetical protein [Halorientalis pallida]|uniref:Uncharacterized protein n=1 Tax=Halorientalis pallida TaxID=2479928 RepID=A0A498L158_9EURY|nr:hypothetical protein [Halorientalis pallida]RXK49453.1 hypothetical protein EAF64_11115 [Halorientalis pallida]
MISRSRISAALLVVGAVLLITPGVVPVQPVLSHEIGGAITAEPSELESEDVEVIAYENLSERGKELYERALRDDGSYVVPTGEGAPDFQYRAELETEREDDSVQRFGPRTVAIERPDDPDFPVVDERVPERRPPESEPGEADETGGGDAEGGARASANTTDAPDDEPDERTAERPRDAGRYNLLRTSFGNPSLTDPGNLLRFVAVLAGVVILGSGGYLRSKP